MAHYLYTCSLHVNWTIESKFQRNMHDNTNGLLAATKQSSFMNGSVRLSVCLWHLFHYVLTIVSSWTFHELLPMTGVMSIQKGKFGGQRSMSQRSKPNLAVSDCNSSLDSHMVMKWHTTLMLLRNGAPLFIQVTRRISRSRGSKHRRSWPK